MTYGRWHIKVDKPHYGKRKRKSIERYEDDLRARMAKKDPRRLAHSLSVARTAEQMALLYGVDPYLARIAGILHDWDKVLTHDQQLKKAQRLGVDLGVPLTLVRPLLHSMTAARSLPKVYPELPPSVWQAISRHTIGAADMSDLDMVIFVADGAEPLRKDVAPIRKVREMISMHRPLEDCYWESFYHGVSYVIETQRYLYPGTLEIYNALALKRSQR